MNRFSMMGHRPYPPPTGPWIMWQAWKRLLFAHWPVPPVMLRAKVPSALDLDVIDGQAWVGIVPFEIEIAPRGLHALPFKHHFNEINVRTYVRWRGEQPGVYFFSLDADDALSVLGARAFYKLPYMHAQIVCGNKAEKVRYRSHRTHHEEPPADFEAEYHPVSEVFNAAPGSLEYWLTERYCLYTTDKRGNLCVGNIHHPPWPLQRAVASIRTNTMAMAHGITLPQSEPHLLYADCQEMLGWPLRQLAP